VLIRLFPFLTVLATLSIGSANAAVMQAIWSGEVTSAEDATAVLFQNAPSLIGAPVTFAFTYDSSRALPITGGQSIDSSNLFGDIPALISQSLVIGGQPILGFDLLRQTVRMHTFPTTFDRFTIDGSSFGQLNTIVTVRQLRAQIADYSDIIDPESLDEPFDWQGGPLQFNVGQLSYRSFDFRDDTTLFSASAEFRWDRVTISRVNDISPVPGPASGLLLVTAIVGGALAQRRKRLVPA
jgi:hypothetical protein